MKKIYSIIALFFVAFSLNAQAVTGMEGIEYTGEVSSRNGQVEVKVSIDPSTLHLKSQEMAIFTPILASAQEQITFNPAVLSGGSRLRSLNRQDAYNQMPFSASPELLSRHNNKSPETIELSYIVPFSEWMRGSDLFIQTEISGCEKCESRLDRLHLYSIEVPQFKVTYVIPEAEVKARNEKYVTRLNYVVDKWDLLVDFKDNARVLAEVDKVIKPIVDNPDFTVTRCVVNGYASPEGRYERNLLLAENRAQAFVNYLRQNYNWDPSTISSKGHGEDWKGLRDTVATMQWFPNRWSVLDIIDNTPDITLRKQKLQRLDGGKIYRDLLQTVYPPLRRNEFEIEYEIRAYSVEEARQVFKQTPGMLSLNELFFLAQSYPADSREFKEIFDTAVRLFPDSEIAKVNAGAMEIESGGETLAAERLKGANLPEAWNNLGVAHALMGEYDKATEYFAKAAEEGEINAEYNLKQLDINTLK